MQKNLYGFDKTKVEWNAHNAIKIGILLESVESREIKIIGGGMHGILETRMGAELDRRRILKHCFRLRHRELEGGNNLSDASIEIKVFSMCLKKVEVQLVAHHKDNFVSTVGGQRETAVKSSAGKGPTWLFDLDYLTDSMNYHPIRSENQANHHAGQQEANQNAEKEANEEAEALRKKFEQETEHLVIQEGAVRTSISTASPHEGLSLSDPTNPEEDDSEIPPLEDIYQNSTDGIFTTSSYDDEGAVADFTNLETVMNNKPKKILEALEDESWVAAMQEELMQFKIQKLWVLVDLPYEKKAIGTKWVYRNKKDERGVVVRNKQLPEPVKFVDDIIFGSTKKSWCDEFEALMKSRFQMSSMGELTFFLGLQVKQKPDGIFISQDNLCCSMVLVTPKVFPSKCVRDFLEIPTQDSGTIAGANLDRKSTIGEAEYVAAASCCGSFVDSKSNVGYGFNLLNTKILHCYEAPFALCLKSSPDDNVANLLTKTFDVSRSIHLALTDEGALQKDHIEAKPTPSPAPTSEVPNEPQTDSSPAQTSEVPIEQQTDPSPRPSPTTIIPILSQKTFWWELLEQRLDRKELSQRKQRVHKEFVSKQGGKFAKGESLVQRDPLFDEIPEDTVDHMDTENAQDVERTREIVDEDKEIDENILSTEDVLSTDKEAVSTDKEKVSTDRPIVSTDGSNGSGTNRQIEEGLLEEVLLRHSNILSTIFWSDETIAKVLLNMSQAKAVFREKEKGPLLKIDPKDKGKKKIEEEDESESESDGIPEVEKKFKQLESDEEMARKIQEEWEGEEERNRIAEEKATNEALIRNFDDIKARIEVDRLLAKKLQEQEREQFTIEERAKFLHDTIAAQRKFLAQQRSEAIRNRPPTKNQLRNQMMTYLKHVGNFKHAELKIKKFEEVQVLYEKIKRSDEDFISIGSAEDERLIKRMNEKGVDSSKEEAKEENKEEAKEENKEEESTRKRKLGTRKKMKSRKKRFIQNTSKDDSEKENDELRLHLTIALDEEKEVDYEILDRKYPIKEWKTECLGTKPQADKAEHLEEINQNVVIRSNGQKRYFSTLMRVLSIFDREDLNAVYQLVMDKYQDEIPEGFDRVLLGDLMVMFNQKHEMSFGFHRGLEYLEKKYPLRKKSNGANAEFSLESEEDSTMALELIRFIQKLAMSSDNTSSAVTYTSISFDSNGLSWGIPLVNAGELLEMDPYKEVAQQGQAHLLSPASVPDPMELDEHVPVYVPEPEHLEYHVPIDDDIQSWRMDSIEPTPDKPEDDDKDPEEDPEEDHTDDPADGEDGDDEPFDDAMMMMTLMMRMRSPLRTRRRRST
ncbi:putative ribonuclease H-like domain-containing protein [Tanacetum coccineum]